MSWVTSPDYENTLGGHRRRRRKELEAGVRSDLDALGGGFDALDKAVKAAGLETERKEDRSRKLSTADREERDALAKAQREAEEYEIKKSDRELKLKTDAEDRARKLPLDDLERKLMEAKIDATVNPKESPRERFLRETAAGKARTEEEASGEAERRKKAKRVLEAAEAAGTDPDDAAAMVESLRTEDAFSEDELNEIRTEITREQEDRRLTKEKREAEIGAIKRRGAPRAGGGGVPRAPDPLKEARTRKAQADAAISESKLANLEQSGVKLSPSERKKIADTFETESQVTNILGLMEKAPPGVTQWAKVQVARSTGLGEVIGEDIDPGGHGRAFYNGLEQFVIEERNRLMGASLTDNEKKAFDRVAAALHQSPETAKLALENYLTSMRLRREAAIQSARLAAGLERGTQQTGGSDAPVTAEEEDFLR
jgi:hypothetical protein